MQLCNQRIPYNNSHIGSKSAWLYHPHVPPQTALTDPTGQYLLNGYFSVCYYKKVLKLPSGGMLQYSGAHGEIERINTTAALKTDLLVYVSTSKSTGVSQAQVQA